MDADILRQWIGRTERRVDRIRSWPVAALSATLDRDDPPPEDGDPLPPGWHWLFFLSGSAARDLGPDGHTRRGGFLPPVPLPRRMWAGGRLTFHRPLHIGELATRTSEVIDVRAKAGRSGDLVFVTVRHTIEGDDGCALEEEHDIVYRANNTTVQANGRANRRPAPLPPGVWIRRVVPDPVLLFRYSALTFNGHRIHYDRSYAQEVEGYPGLVVHGPLLATLLLDLVRRNLSDRVIRRFSFRALAPLFDTAPFTVQGTPAAFDGMVALSVVDLQGAQSMVANAVLL